MTMPWAVEVTEDDVITVGCERHTLEIWERDYREIGARHGRTPSESDEDIEVIRRASAIIGADQYVLERIATYEPTWQLRHLAVEHIADQSVLERLATSDGNEYVRYVAVGRLTARAVLAPIAVSDAHCLVRYAASARLVELAIQEMK